MNSSNRNTRISLEGCELQLRQSQRQKAAPALARLKIRNPPMLFQGPQTPSDADSRLNKYVIAPHLVRQHPTTVEMLERERLAAAVGSSAESSGKQPVGYRDLSLALNWPLLACGSVHSDLYMRSMATAAADDAQAAAAAANAEASAPTAGQSHRRRKDPVLMHEERIFNQDRVLRALERR